MKLILRAAVRKDLRDIADYIARDNPANAVGFSQQLVNKINKIAEQPLIFPIKEEWGVNIRSALHGHYHIIFEVDGDSVIVLRILHGARNIPDILA